MREEKAIMLALRVGNPSFWLQGKHIRRRCAMILMEVEEASLPGFAALPYGSLHRGSWAPPQTRLCVVVRAACACGACACLCKAARCIVAAAA